MKAWKCKPWHIWRKRFPTVHNWCVDARKLYVKHDFMMNTGGTKLYEYTLRPEVQEWLQALKPTLLGFSRAKWRKIAGPYHWGIVAYNGRIVTANVPPPIRFLRKGDAMMFKLTWVAM